MIILDENINASQRELLRKWRFPIRQIGVDVAKQGIQDEQVIPFLLQLRRPTFFTRDIDFYSRQLCHLRYSLVFLYVEKYEVASFVRRFLHHSTFDSQEKRMGVVARVSPIGITVWRPGLLREERHNWEK